MFSQRTRWTRAETPLAQAIAARRAAGLPLTDLSASNPTQCGFSYDAPSVLRDLSNPQALIYHPEPTGLPAAREAVCAYYRSHSALVEPNQVCLTTSTSEAYSFLFRLLCDPGDEVLIAQPSYPLFDFLADLDDVRLVLYPLFYDHGWQTEPNALESRITPRTRALAVVHPNNPTGHYVSPSDRADLERLCTRHNLALIVDEVFLDYPLSHPGQTFASGDTRALTFVLSGLSKIAALPQMKTSWIVTLGPHDLRHEALARLELIADTFLSVSAPVQLALGNWLADRNPIQNQITARVRQNLTQLDSQLQNTTVSRLAVEAGWYAVLRVPALGPDEAFAVKLAQEQGILVHPGFYYGFPDQGWLVVSLLPEPQNFTPAIQSLLAACQDRAGT